MVLFYWYWSIAASTLVPIKMLSRGLGASVLSHSWQAIFFMASLNESDNFMMSVRFISEFY